MVDAPLSQAGVELMTALKQQTDLQQPNRGAWSRTTICPAWGVGSPYPLERGPAAAGATKSKRAPRPAKYKYQEDGQEKTWTGQGRMPKAIAEQVALGKDLNDYLI